MELESKVCENELCAKVFKPKSYREQFCCRKCQKKANAPQYVPPDKVVNGEQVFNVDKYLREVFAI